MNKCGCGTVPYYYKKILNNPNESIEYNKCSRCGILTLVETIVQNPHGKLYIVGSTMYKILNELYDYMTCPNCRSTDVEVTCMGFAPPDPDPNRRECEKCHTTWYHPDYIKLMQERRNG